MKITGLKFLGEPHMEPFPPPDKWALLEDWPLDIGIDGVVTRITVPKVFVTDLLSIPHPIRDAFPKDGPGRQAAVIHDYLCKLKGRPTVGERISFSSADAAAVFLAAMSALSELDGSGMFIGQRYLYWAMVRVFGPKFPAIKE